MESYNTIARYFFPLLFFLQYIGCDSYDRMRHNTSAVDAVEVRKVDCSDLKKYTYNGFYASSDTGKLFVKKDTYNIDSLKVIGEPIIAMKQIKSILKTYNAMNKPTLQVIFTDVGRRLFKEHTAKNIKQKVAVIVKDKLVMAPIINEEIVGGVVEISGNFTQEEVDEMYTHLNKILICLKTNGE